MLKEVNSFITINLTTQEAAEYNALVEKSIAKFGYKADELEEFYNVCPRCNSLVHRNDNYCSKCGQRVEFIDYREQNQTDSDSDDESVEDDEKTAEIEDMSRTEPSADDIIPFDSDEF